MIKLVKRSTLRAASVKKLKERVHYISDPNHKDHAKKIVLPAQNYNCPGQQPKDFVGEVVRLDEEYHAYRKGRLGKRSKRLFEEIAYSSTYGAYLTDMERDTIETAIMARLRLKTACRTAWHIDTENGRADLHIFLAAKNGEYPPKVTLWATFGGKEGKHLFAELDHLDVEIVTTLNQSRPNKKLQSARRVRLDKVAAAKGKKPSLALEIARHTTKPITRENIAMVIAELGHEVTKLTSRTVSVVFAGGRKPRRYSHDDLLPAITAEQELTRARHLAPPSLLGPEPQ